MTEPPPSNPQFFCPHWDPAGHWRPEVIWSLNWVSCPWCEIERLTRELADWKHARETAMDEVMRVSHNEARLRAALEFYADPATYFAIGFVPDYPAGEFMQDFTNTGELGWKPGKLAREALRPAGETAPAKPWFIECDKCGRQDNPGYGCNALQNDGTRCNGTMRRTDETSPNKAVQAGAKDRQVDAAEFWNSDAFPPDQYAQAIVRSLSKVTALKPRPCPHGKVWLVGDQVCACPPENGTGEQ